MSLLGNILWLIFGGLIAGLGYILGGLLVCVTIVGIPFGVQAMKIGVATFAPFGKQIVETKEANRPLRLILNIVWLVVIGWEIALAHAASALVLAITIIGIPFALQHLKLIPLALLPFGRSLA
ncbi:MAG: YccF domain-containing protein [Vicinamibacteria bacterium]